MKKYYLRPEVDVVEVEQKAILTASEVIEDGWEDDPAAPPITDFDNDDMLVNEE